MKNDIIWAEWNDPMLPLVQGRIPKKHGPEEDEHDASFHRAKNSFGKTNKPNPYFVGAKASGTGPAIISPMGIIPIHESNLPSLLFNFWMGHTNFDITPYVRDVISDVPGVETFDIFTRYRFRIGIGKSFEEEAVKHAIELAMNPIPVVNVSKTQTPLDGMKKLLSRKYKFWAIHAMANKSFRYIGGTTQEEVEKKGEQLAAASVIRSWEPK
jgi:hypothetical protein